MDEAIKQIGERLKGLREVLNIPAYEYVGEELPDDFICPLCKHPASDFEKVVKKTEVK